MPPRYLTITIVAFWLAATSWLFVRELKPRLWPSGAPPFSIDLTEEAQSNITTHWTIYKEDADHGYCRTWIRYRPHDDTYELHGEFKLWTKERGARLPDLVIMSMYRVTREGHLREISAGLSANLIATVAVEGRIAGKVDNGLFAPEIWITKPVEFRQELKPVAVTEGGSVLNPLQPLHRLPGLRKGQRWEIPLVDPLSDVAHKYLKEVAGTLVNRQLRILQAEVLPQTEILVWGSDNERVRCLVIEYHGEDTYARTWVRERDGMVLRQEIKQDREHLTLVRD